MSKPEFVDNLDGNTLETALRSRLEGLLEELREPPELSVATGYFNPEGFGRLADLLEETPRVRLLLGAEPLPDPHAPERKLGDPRGERFERRRIRETLEATDEQMKRDRDHMPFSPKAHDQVATLLKFLESGKVEVRRYERRFLHGKAFLFSNQHGVLAGSSNFTGAGLTRNLELNLGHYAPYVLGQVEDWFERLWEEAEPFDLAEIYRARFGEYDPHLIYLRFLWELYGDDLEEEAKEADGRIRLTRFQRDGVARAKRILATYNGVVVADSVGLGKSFIAADILSEVIHQNRQRGLLVAPASLRDGMWQRFCHHYQIPVQVVSFEELADDGQLGQGEKAVLSSDIDEYSLVVVDEAHAVRNPETKRARALSRLLVGDPPKKVVLLTATPVNNSLWDLYDLLNYFVGHDAVFADKGIPSLKSRFEDAAAHDPFTLRPEVLFDVLDATTVRRTRRFVQRHYADDTIDQGAGEEPIRFPDPVVQSRTYALDSVLPGFFDRFAEALDPNGGSRALTMARYQPSRYERSGSHPNREAALVGLIRSGLLKRFESSAGAFVASLDRMIRANDHFLRVVESRGRVPAPDTLAQLQETDSDEDWEQILEAGETLTLEDLDVEALRRDVEHDRAILASLRDEAARIRPEHDPKIDLLIEEMARAAQEAEEKGLSEQDERNRRKVLVFSYFADTIEWMAGRLEEAIDTDPRLRPYRDRLTAIRGTESYGGVTREQAVFGFAPTSTEAPPGSREDRFDILLSTDILAEGMNLQQCGRIINFDLPWNPMRLVQRHGRIDRIGSPHDQVALTCVFPDKELDRLLALEYRIREKLAQAAATVGLDQVVLPGMDKVERDFADDMEEIEALREENPDLFVRGGEDSDAHIGEEYRQELRRGIEGRGSEITSLPWGVGSGIVRGGEAGYAFCARIFDRVQVRFVPSDPEGEILRGTVGCLSRIQVDEGAERVLSESVAEGAYDAWERAREDIFEEWMHATDPKNLQPSVRPLFQKAAHHVRQNPAPGMSREDQDRLASCLEAPRGLRHERRLRQVFDPETAKGGEATRRIAEVARELSWKPWSAPEPLPMISKDDIHVVVWMAVLGE